MEPQGRVSDRPKSPHRKGSRQRPKGKKNQPKWRSWVICQRTKEHNPMDSDDDDEVPQKRMLKKHFQTRNLQYQYFLPNQDQHRVHTIHRPAQLRPIHKEDRPRPVLKMNPLTTMTGTEKENLAQQCKMHQVMTQDGQCSTQTFGSFCFVTTENGEQQDLFNLTTIPCVQWSLCLDELTNDSSSAQVQLPKGVVWPPCGKAAGARAKRRSRVRKEASALEVRRYHKQFGYTKHLEWKSWIMRILWSAVIKKNKFSSLVTTVPVRLLQEVLVLFVFKQISQFGSFGKRVQTLCLPEAGSTFPLDSISNSWGKLGEYCCG